jgi:hypothetical protein
VALNCLEKGCTNAVGVPFVVLQGLVVILAGLEIFRDDCGAMIGEDVQEDPVQKELGVAMHALAWRRGWRGVRLVVLARGCVVGLGGAALRQGGLRRVLEQLGVLLTIGHQCD